MRNNVWPRDMIRELLARAAATGRASATLASAREAELFRFAVYNFRRREALGLDLRIFVNGTTVVAELPPMPPVSLDNLSIEVA